MSEKVTPEHYIRRMLDGIDMTQEEKDDCANNFWEYWESVILKAMHREDSLLVEDYDRAIHAAIMGFIGGYASRHLYSWKKDSNINN